MNTQRRPVSSQEWLAERLCSIREKSAICGECDYSSQGTPPEAHDAARSDNASPSPYDQHPTHPRYEDHGTYASKDGASSLHGQVYKYWAIVSGSSPRATPLEQLRMHAHILSGDTVEVHQYTQASVSCQTRTLPEKRHVFRWHIRVQMAFMASRRCAEGNLDKSRKWHQEKESSQVMDSTHR